MTRAKIIFLFVLFGKPLFGQHQQTLNTQSQIIDSICNAINRYYVYPEKAKAMTDFIKQQNQADRYSALSNPNDLARQINKDLHSIHNDRHLRVEFDPELESDIIKFMASKQDANAATEGDINKDKQKNFHFKKIEILPSNIGYIEFTNFTKPSLEARKTVYAAMAFVAHTEALIIDLRNNFGGNGTMSGEILSYFFKSKTLAGRSFNRIDNKWTDNYIENNPVITNGLVLEMPIYVLTSPRTFSAAEGFAYTLQNLNKAVVVGDTTRGGAHLTRSFSLGNGFVGFIPYMRSENLKTKTDWEGKGVIPEISVDEKDCLMAAQMNILNRKLDRVVDTIEQKKVKWLINYYKSKNATIDIKSADVEKFVGRFAEFEITLSGNQLYFKDVHNHKTSEKMIPISTTLFQVLGDYQVEFLLDEKENCYAIRMYWDDGWVEDTKRTK